MAKTNSSYKVSKKNAREFRGQLLNWYDENRRDLPWRAKAGEGSDPYHVWLSEIMLQQTTVTAVKPYFLKFLEKWPMVQDLAAAPQEEVMKEWAGLGYYARARNLYKCADIVANDLGGVFPQDQAALKRLPGIGDYTSAAIRTIAFNKPATVVDGNIERVMARYHLVEEPLPKSKPALKALAGHYFDDERPGDFAQALMDLGAEICIPKAPRCGFCPLSRGCSAYKTGAPGLLPAKTTKKPKPQKIGHVYWIDDGNGSILLHRRPERGLLGGMVGLPTSEWVALDTLNSLAHLIPYCKINDFESSIYHTFTHFDLELKLATFSVKNEAIPKDHFWENLYTIKNHGFPSVFQKALNVFLPKIG